MLTERGHCCGCRTDIIVAHQPPALKPVVAGDTLTVHASVVELVAGNNPKYGTVHVNYSVRNQKEEEVMTFLQIMLARRRVQQGA